MATILSGLPTYQLFPLGDAAIVVQLSQTIDPVIQSSISALTTYLCEHPFNGFIELVPAYTSITIYYNPWVVSRKGKIDPYQKVVEILQKSLTIAPATSDLTATYVKEIPVCYGGKFGPDLEFVAVNNQLSVAEVIALHTAETYIVYMIGFAPGFPYLGGLNNKIATPRKQMPRTTIPAGSVGIAGEQTGIYPMQTPGGWQLIGRTPEKLFDPARSKPSLLQAGDRVKFVSISVEDFEKRKEQLK
jgi:inhibitor of KinA